MTDSTNSANDFLMASGVPSIKLSKVGDEASGIMIRKAELQQIRDFVEGTPLFWEDGNKKMQLVITLQTDVRDPAIENDDGIRNLYAKAQMQVALRQAIRKAGAKGLEVGCRISVKVTDLKANSNPKLKPQKIHEIVYESPTEVENEDLGV